MHVQLNRGVQIDSEVISDMDNSSDYVEINGGVQTSGGMKPNNGRTCMQMKDNAQTSSDYIQMSSAPSIINNNCVNHCPSV